MSLRAKTPSAAKPAMRQPCLSTNFEQQYTATHAKPSEILLHPILENHHNSHYITRFRKHMAIFYFVRSSQEGTTLGRGDAAILRPARQQDNCQVAVSLSLANHDASLPVAYRLYLPEDWALGPSASGQGQKPAPAKAGVPATVAFQTQAGDRLGADQSGSGGGAARGRGADGCRLRQRHRAAN